MKGSYKIVVIDDDEIAVDNLIFELKAYPQFQIEGFAKNGISGRKLIFKTMPDLIFLDVELPDMHGSELLNLIRNEITWNMQVIFYTAYNKYMLDAIRGSAFDYLLKPIDKEDLSTMMKRFIDKVEDRQTQTVPYHIQLRSLSPLEQTLIIPRPRMTCNSYGPRTSAILNTTQAGSFGRVFSTTLPTRSPCGRAYPPIKYWLARPLSYRYINRISSTSIT